MNKKLAGTLLVYEGNKFDYCFKEAVKGLLEFCDYVIVAAGGEDETFEDVVKMSRDNRGSMDVIEITEEDWGSQHGKEKLNYFTNKAIQFAEQIGFDYQFNLQADEILHEASYKYIRLIIDSGCESYMCKRINLWSSPYTQLNVPLSRMPCSSEIVRLAKTKYRSWDDAENIKVDEVNQSYTNLIEIWHYGFVRDKTIMKQKVINIQEKVFGVEHDKKLDGTDIFESERWFSKEDLKPINKPHPKIMAEWIKTRP